MSDLRVGIGVDAHGFSDAARLVLGGVEFRGEAGLAGHSDGDVLAHALVDAVLGAAGLGDIGGVGLRVLTFGASVAEGGVPIVSGGKVVGAIGVSGVQSHQDVQVAQAGADAVK